MSRLWDKGADLDQRVLRYTAGEDHALDNRLVAYDVRASIAHAEMLHLQGLISADDFAAIARGLSEIGRAHASGKWSVQLEHEDGQTALENLLVAAIGEAGKRVHLGRSRNDQVLTALRLYLKDAIGELEKQRHCGCRGARRAWQARGRRAATRLHPHAAGDAQLGGIVGRRFRGRVARRRGRSAPVPATPRQESARLRRRLWRENVPLDRERTRAALGFANVQQPVTAVQLSRGKAEAQVLFEIALVMQDAGRLAADLLLFYTQEFSFVALPDAFTTGSSIMPQKRNPDVFELIRGRTATASAALSEVLGIVAKLPSGYQRDLQLIKAPLFRAIDVCLDTLAILAAALPGVKFRPEHIELDPAIHAAEAANELVVKEGISFREAYRRIAEKLKRR